jgi:hypothetical protein
MKFLEGAAIETGADGCYLRYCCGTCYGFPSLVEVLLRVLSSYPLFFIFGPCIDSSSCSIVNE